MRYSVIRNTVRETQEAFTDDMGRVITWNCQRCPWHRDRTNTEAWERLVICHPNYGNVTNYEAYKYDIATHDCDLTRAARFIHGIPNVLYKGPYTQREESHGSRRAD